MIVREVLDQEKNKYDYVVHHPLQTWAWGDFKLKTGVDVARLAAFEGQNIKSGYQFTIHQIPHTNFNLGYFAKGDFPDDAQLFALKTIAAKHKLIFIKIEPNVAAPAGSESEVLKKAREYLTNNGAVPGRAMFTPHSFLLDISKPETDLFNGLKSKTRYNIKVAEKHGVTVSVDNSDAAFEEYINLWKQTTSRQGFYSHTEDYHRNMWQVMKGAGIAHLMKATYQNQPLGVWILFIFNHTLYYPYGASSREHREVMANNLLAWEAIRYGKSQDCTSFDMWGSLGQNPDEKDPWYGFHRFKEGYGGTLMEFVGSYDLIFNPQIYQLYQIADNLRWKWLRFRSKLPF